MPCTNEHMPLAPAITLLTFNILITFSSKSLCELFKPGILVPCFRVTHSLSLFGLL